ncbi:MAG: NAD(P)/FAD-dependent oxidoreductase [Proteobacteria bacterium]|nr:NAD(P)/FAD-dependent oxidoreductase [Pseudomonadota bacterium]
MPYDVIIIGAGPGGLACAAAAASHGLTTLVLERKQIIGRKVCAGGITWNGLLKKIPFDISEKQFAKQQVFTRFQKVCVLSPTPIIATVNREKLAQKMAQLAIEAGGEIRLGCKVSSIDYCRVLCEDKVTGRKEELAFRFLVGADGSSSLVRRYLGLPVSDIGIGINYQIPGDYPEMQWHLDSSLFANGYAWVFPHRNTASIGAYVNAKHMKASTLKANLHTWGDKQGYPLRQHKASAELINFDFRGWHFDNTFLVGDAAGLASGLTGEGIYPAIISGETVGHFLANPEYDVTPLRHLIKNQARHRKMVTLTGKNRALATAASEIVTFCLKTRILDFSHIEMAH